MLFTLRSTNPNFSWVIQKNPQTILDEMKPFSRSLKKGMVYGWFLPEKYGSHGFRLWFQDSPVDTSYGNQEFEYLDKTRYSDPRIPLGIISECLRSASKVQDEKDTPAQAVASFSCYIPKIVRDRLLGQITETVTITYVPAGGAHNENFVEAIISGKTIFEVLNWVQIVCVLAAIKNKETYIQLKEHDVVKYLTILKNANAPYKVWAYFCSRAITSPGLFDNVKHLINNENQTLQYGDAHIQRRNFIETKFSVEDKSTSLVDIGCGELIHSFRLSGKYDSILAIDANSEYEEINPKKIKARGLDDKITFLCQKITGELVDQFPSVYEGCDVLLTEVLEHMPEKDAEDLLAAVLKCKPNRVIVTVPNGAFNKHYGMKKGEIRHPEHEWEPNDQELFKFITKVTTKVGNKKLKLGFFPVGDKVNEYCEVGGQRQLLNFEASSHGVVFTFDKE